MEPSLALCKQGVAGSIPATSTNITCKFKWVAGLARESPKTDLFLSVRSPGHGVSMATSSAKFCPRLWRQRFTNPRPNNRLVTKPGDRGGITSKKALLENPITVFLHESECIARVRRVASF